MRHHFVAQLLVSHLTAVFIVGLKQHGKQVALIQSAGAPFGDDSINDLVKLSGRLMKTPVSWRGQPIIKNPLQCCLRRKRFDDL